MENNLYLKKSMDCLFCKIINKIIPAHIIFETDVLLAFRDIRPQTPDHILIIPKKHMASLNEATSEDTMTLGQLLCAAVDICEKLGHLNKGYRLVMNTGENGGQTVPHIHLHLLAGRPMHWPPG